LGSKLKKKKLCNNFLKSSLPPFYSYFGNSPFPSLYYC